MATADRKDYYKEWRLKNMDHLREYRRKYRKENKTTIANNKHKRTLKKDPDYEYKNLQSYFNKRNPYETIL